MSGAGVKSLRQLTRVSRSISAPPENYRGVEDLGGKDLLRDCVLGESEGESEGRRYVLDTRD